MIRISCAVERNCLDVGDGTEAPLLGLYYDDIPVIRDSPIVEEDAAYEDGYLAC